MRILRPLADLPLSLQLATRAKHLSERIIRRHMQIHFDDAARNGEDWILSVVAPSSRRFVDVGANRGDFTAAFLANSADATGLVFEPAFSACEKLRTRFRAQPSVHIIQKAVSDVCCVMPFFEEPDAGLGSSLTQSCARPDAIRTEVEVTTLDTELRERQYDEVDFVKVDAEGQDFAVMKGAARLLSAGAVRFLQFEYHATWAQSGATLRAAFDFLSLHGYHAYLLKGQALYEPNYEAYGEYFSYSNYVAVRRSDVHLVEPHVKGRI